MDSVKQVGIMFQKALENVENGKKEHSIILCGPKGCHYRDKDFASKITTAISCTWDSKGIISCHEWGEGTAPQDDVELVAIIKKRRKLLLADKNIGYFASGATDQGGADVTKTLLYFQCNGIATFVVASSDTPTIHIVDYLQDLDVDPLQVALHDLLSHNAASAQGEVIKDGGSARQENP